VFFIREVSPCMQTVYGKCRYVTAKIDDVIIRKDTALKYVSFHVNLHVCLFYISSHCCCNLAYYILLEYKSYDGTNGRA